MRTPKEPGVSQATEKIGFACEKQGRPSEMLKMYYEDIRKFGNDPNNVGVDGILKKYAAKYKEYDDLYGKTLDLLEKLQTPAQPVSFTYRSRKGVEETISGTMEEILQDRKNCFRTSLPPSREWMPIYPPRSPNSGRLFS